MKNSCDVLVVVHWKVTRKLTVNGGPVVLENCLCLPDFDVELFPFILDYGTADAVEGRPQTSSSYYLVDLSNGRREAIIADSAQNDHEGR